MISRVNNSAMGADIKSEKKGGTRGLENKGKYEGLGKVKPNSRLLVKVVKGKKGEEEHKGRWGGLSRQPETCIVRRENKKGTFEEGEGRA